MVALLNDDSDTLAGVRAESWMRIYLRSQSQIFIGN